MTPSGTSRDSVECRAPAQARHIASRPGLSAAYFLVLTGFRLPGAGVRSRGPLVGRLSSLLTTKWCDVDSGINRFLNHRMRPASSPASRGLLVMTTPFYSSSVHLAQLQQWLRLSTSPRPLGYPFWVTSGLSTPTTRSGRCYLSQSNMVRPPLTATDSHRINTSLQAKYSVYVSRGGASL
jgi:hypothetical protein